MPKLTVLISTFQIECIIKFIIHISVTPPPASTMTWRKTEEKHSMLLSSCLFNTDSEKSHKHWRCFCGIVSFVPSICCRSAIDSTETKAGSYLHVAGRQAGCLLLLCLVSSRANSRPSLYQSLRFLWSPAGSCCRSSKCGPGSIFSTSSMLRHPGRAKTWVRRMLSGA